MGGATFSQPWRFLPENNQDILDFLNSYKPKNKDASHLRILLIGPVGAGKSAFINSVDSVLQGRVSGRVLTDATTTTCTSFTKKYKTYKFSKGNQGHYSFVFNDIMGIEKMAGVHVEDIKLALKGHVKDKYKFNPEKQLKAGDPDYNSSPDLNDKVHVLVTVVPASSMSLLSKDTLDKLRDVRMAASDLGIPQMAVLTKVDEACPEAKKNPNNIYKSKYLKQQFDQLNHLLGLPLNCIFLVKNYNSEIDTNAATDAHILCALKQMIVFGEEFLNHLND
ncbi:interferon-induced protein 44-like [Archocentrus centrarchus]|uniref:interferon-induced protein 44-like n=1 Tax=Archocentrus centrarchus TaxID=63155 RepID=UPI0011E9E028|nr:interferon-induced protein 44-like [Archocentrus centrarchus]